MSQHLPHGVQVCDMKRDMALEAISLANEGLRDPNLLHRQLAEKIKKKFDEKYGSTWHCIVGSDFGSYVAHEKGSLVYFDIGDVSVLLWRA